ncbi:hypothetical protein D3C78_1767650 [compost metagenome]
MELSRYPMAISYFETYFRQLYAYHALAFNNLGGLIAKVQTICNDSGDITGAVFGVVPTIPHIKSILNPILQLGYNPTNAGTQHAHAIAAR